MEEVKLDQRSEVVDKIEIHGAVSAIEEIRGIVHG